MTPLSDIWLPLILSAVAVFVFSSLIHMVLPWHKNEYPRLPNEDEVINVLRPMAIPPGDYMMPRASGPKEMATPEFAEKLKHGPVMVMTVLPNGPFNMGRNLALWFGYSLLISIIAGYVGGTGLPPGSEFMAVFRTIALVAFAGYALALWQMWIWYNRSLRTTVKATIDGLLYALVTAGILAWMWP